MNLKKKIFPAQISEFVLPAFEMWGIFAVCTKFSSLTAHVRRAWDQNEDEQSRPKRVYWTHRLNPGSKAQSQWDPNQVSGQVRICFQYPRIPRGRMIFFLDMGAECQGWDGPSKSFRPILYLWLVFQAFIYSFISLTNSCWTPTVHEAFF